MAPLISSICSLPGRPTLSPRWLGFLSERPINLRVPLMSLHRSSHHASSHLLTHSSSTTSPPHLVIITPAPGKTPQAGLPCSRTTPGPGLLVRLGSLQALSLCGVSCTWRSLLLRRGWRRWRGRRLTQAEHRAQREREVVETGAVMHPRSWTSNQVGKEKCDKLNFSVCKLILCIYSSSVDIFSHLDLICHFCVQFVCPMAMQRAVRAVR